MGYFNVSAVGGITLMSKVSNSNPLEHKPILYRPDIDGLRTIAVGIVILFHIWPAMLTGGFVGVDVFFVISGFLITSIINKELINGEFSFLRFYTRRIKRILPVFYSMIILTSILAYMIILPMNYTTYAKSSVSASSFISNWYFYQLSGYFSVNSSEYPLLHTWSLSVEEQYYVFWPLVLLLLTKLSKKIFWIKPFVIGLLFIFSYLFSIYCIKHNSEMGYFSILSRAFELMLGSILALLIAKDHNYLKKLEPKFLHTLANICSLMGMLFIGFSSCLLTDKSAFPGYIALVPVLGACMIIYAGHLSHRCVVNQILATKPFVAIGLLSYSLYLWHWPLLAFWHYYNPWATISLKTGLIILLISIILSIASYLLIELPIKRRRYSCKSAFIKFQVIPFIFVAINVPLVYLNMRIEPKLRMETTFLDHKYCFGQITGDCIVGSMTTDNQPQAFLFGDSHAGMFAPFWESIGEAYNFKIKTNTIGGCYPLMNINNELALDDFPSNKDECFNQAKYLYQNFDKYNLFIINGEWSKYYNNSHGAFKFKTEFERMIEFLVQHDKKVIVMGDIPSYENHVILTMLRQSMLKRFANSSNITLVQNDYELYNDKMHKLVSKYPGVYYFDTQQLLINQIKGYPYFNDFLLYDDDSHLNQVGSKILAQEYLSSSKPLQLVKLLEFWGILTKK